MATPATPGNTASLAAVSASSSTDAWAIGRTQVNRSNFAPGAAIVQAVGFSGSSGAENPLAEQNG